jgi:HEAT repeat protein
MSAFAALEFVTCFAAVPLLLPLLDDKDGNIRLRALLLLAGMSPLSEDTVTGFIKARDPNLGNRMAAIAGLGRPAVTRKGVLPTLLAALASKYE